MIREVRKAVTSRDAEAIAATSHALKGASGNFGRIPAFHTALELERIGKTGRVDEADAVFKTLERDLASLCSQLRTLRK